MASIVRLKHVEGRATPIPAVVQTVRGRGQRLRLFNNDPVAGGNGLEVSFDGSTFYPIPPQTESVLDVAFHKFWLRTDGIVTTGAGDSFSFSSPTVTLTDAAGLFTAAMVGQYVTITGSTTPANDGTFLITAQGGTTLDFTNSAGVAEPFTGAWAVSETVDYLGLMAEG